jgi:hypothetical protein
MRSFLGRGRERVFWNSCRCQSTLAVFLAPERLPHPPAPLAAKELWPLLEQLGRYSRPPAPKERSARPQGGRVGETSPGKPQLRQGCAGYRRANFSAHNSRPQLPLRRVLPSPPGRAGGMRGPILEAALAAKARWPSLSCCRNRPAHPPLPVAASARWRPLLQLRK